MEDVYEWSEQAIPGSESEDLTAQSAPAGKIHKQRFRGVACRMRRRDSIRI